MGVRILLTGADGFVGPHLVRALNDLYGGAVDLVLSSRRGGQCKTLGTLTALDVGDVSAVDAVIAKTTPQHVVHLAAVSSVDIATSEPDVAWHVNVMGTRNIARSILARVPTCRMVNIGSGLVYGDVSTLGRASQENDILAPADEYGVTKAAADLSLGVMARQGLNVIRFRPFNHIGPGQSEAFAISAFAMQIARIEAKLSPPQIMVGNLDAERDFLDVRDVARAYALATLRPLLPAGLILNIASGIPLRISHVLERLLTKSHFKVDVVRDPLRTRASELRQIMGDASAAQRILGWKPIYTIDETLDAVLEDCRLRTANER